MEPPMLEIGILGPVEVARGGEPVDVRQRNERALLAYLALNPNVPVGAASLVGALWRTPPKSAANMLQIYVSRLRRALGRAAIVTHGGGYVLTVDPASVDAVRFEMLADEARKRLRSGSYGRAVARFRRALALWRGDALADVGPAPFAAAERARLEDMRLLAVEDLTEAELALGNHADVVAQLEALVARHPLRERLRGQLMVALYRAGLQAEALACYREGRRALVDALGIEPRSELRRLERAILSHDASLEPSGRLRAAHARVPAPAGPLVGRSEELRELAELLGDEDVRLVTLVGPGGVGKTRLALEAARAIGADVFDVVAYLPLDEVADAALVPGAIARALGLRTSDDVPGRLAEHLAGRTALLVVDSLEHLVATAPFLARLLTATPALMLLVTSRAPLHIRAEHEFPVAPLAVPDVRTTDVGELSRNPSVALFVQRARAVDPRLALTQSNARAIAEICCRLEGLPLSIELAAARSKSLPAAALVERLVSRLDLLVDGPQDAPPRHQTLRATLEWSYTLLSAEEQRVFAALAMFAGSFSLDAAERVCGPTADVVPSVLSLQDKALLRGEGGSTVRFSMLDTIREYAAERLKDSAEKRDLELRHATFYAELAEAIEPELSGPRQAAAFERLETDYPNLQAALAYGVEHDPSLALRLAVALRRFWSVHGRIAQGRKALEEALAASPSDASPLRTTALRAAGVFAVEQGDDEAARRFWEESLSDARRAGLLEEVASSTTNLGGLALENGDFPRATRLLEKAAALHARLGDVRRRSIALTNLGIAATLQGRLERAISLLEESVDGFRTEGDLSRVAGALQPLARAYLSRGDDERAQGILIESLSLARELRDQHVIADCLETFAAALQKQGEDARSATLLGAASAVREPIGAPRGPDMRDLFHDTLETVRSELGAEAFDVHWEEGRALDPEAAVEFAVAEAARSGV
jgi:predicted ATPase/DNA-binding SARP family transcriptional activator